MAAASYYNQLPVAEDKQPLHPAPRPSPLRPMMLANSHQKRYSESSQSGYYDNEFSFEPIKEAQQEDEHLKARIRRLRIVSRLLGFLVSVAVFIPITLTLHKFLSTRNTFKDVHEANGTVVNRTAWALDSKVWPTYMYFAVAASAVLLNLIILLSYLFGGVKRANQAATVSSLVVLAGNLAIWGAAVGIYRQQKDYNGKSNDLWGWTCSGAAQQIQDVFEKQVNFNQYCSAQSISFYAGIVQVGLAILTIIIYTMAFLRRKTKKNLARQSRVFEGYEPYGSPRH